VKQYVQECADAGSRGGTNSARIFVEPELPDFAKWGKTERVSMRGVRRKPPSIFGRRGTRFRTLRSRIAPTSRNWNIARQIRASTEEAGGKMTVDDDRAESVRFCAEMFPQFNASIDMGKEEIIYKQYINIGVAWTRIVDCWCR